MNKICLISLGCAKNLIDSEQMLSMLDGAGYAFTDDAGEADTVIINTCAFVESAKSEAIENILAAGELKKSGKLKKLIVTGCLAQRYKDELFAEMPEIDALVGTGSVEEIVEAVRDTQRRGRYGDINAPIPQGDRAVSTGPGWAYLKIAEGCSNRCAYCVIPSIRGKFRSRPMEEILEEARALTRAGAKEIIAVAQDPTMYGMDLYKKRALPELIRELCRIPELRWLRLHYLYPDGVTEELIETIALEPKVLKYLDIPIQHINNGILKAMRRRGTGDEIRRLLPRLRERIPGVVLRTSLITGLPGEGEAEFQELCDFLREARIPRVGVFPFSPEEGTEAYEMDYPPQETAVSRAETIYRLQAGIMEEFNASRVGKTYTVLCEGYDPDTGLYVGRSFAESPDVDGYIYFGSPDEVPAGEMVEVTVRGELDGEIAGEIAQKP